MVVTTRSTKFLINAILLWHAACHVACGTFTSEHAYCKGTRRQCVPIGTTAGPVQTPPNRRSASTPYRCRFFLLEAGPRASPDDASWPVGPQQSRTCQVSLTGRRPSLAHQEFDVLPTRCCFSPPGLFWPAGLPSCAPLPPPAQDGQRWANEEGKLKQAGR